MGFPDITPTRKSSAETVSMDAQPGSFLKGWRSLPDELKLQILALALPADHTYREMTFRSGTSYSLGAPTQQLDDLVYPLLSIPEVQGLVLEAWYTQNTFSFRDKGDGFHKNASFDLPPAHMRPYVRSMQLKINKNGDIGLRLLTAIVDGSLGFKNMHDIEITFDCYKSREFTAYLKAMPVLEFPTRSLKVKYRHDVYNGPIEGFGYGTEVDLTEMPLLEKFSTGDGRAKLEWVRYYESRKGKEMTKAWPAVTHDNRERFTEKIARV
jgi:hypothetical protein